MCLYSISIAIVYCWHMEIYTSNEIGVNNYAEHASGICNPPFKDLKSVRVFIRPLPIDGFHFLT